MILELGTTPVVPQIRKWLRGVDLNHRPLGYEPNELPDCSTPRSHHSNQSNYRQRAFGNLGTQVSIAALRTKDKMHHVIVYSWKRYMTPLQPEGPSWKPASR